MPFRYAMPMRSLRQSLPPLNALAVFEAAARHVSFTRAAAELNIAQSAVSRHVSNLEADVGVSLFVRNGNKLALTGSGRALLGAVDAGLGRIRDTVDMIRRRHRQEATLTIGCSYTMADSWLMPRFGALRGALPDAQLRLLTSDAYLDFDTDDVDLSIRYGRAGDWPSFQVRKLMDEVVFPVCAPDLLARHPGLAEDSAEAWAEAPLLHFTLTSQGRIDWNEWYRPLGIVPSGQGPYFTTYPPMLQEALAGRGIALGWQGLVDAHLDSGQLVRLTDRAITSDQAFFIVYRSDAREAMVEAAIAILSRGRAGVA